MLNDSVKKNLRQLVDMATVNDDYETVKRIKIDHLKTVQAGGCGVPQTGGACQMKNDQGFSDFLKRISGATPVTGGARDDTDEDYAPAYKPVDADDSWEAPDEIDESYDIDDENISVSTGFDMDEYQDGGKRERNAEADDIYRGFLKKIQDALDVDEETAYVYRALAKAAVTTKNPELKKFSNEALKNKEIAKIIESKSKLKALTKGRDIEEIKQRIRENRAKYAAQRDSKKETKPKKKTEPSRWHNSRYHGFEQSEEIRLSLDDDDY